MTVSLCIVALNEGSHLPKLLEQILNQSFPKSETELVFTDSGSVDNTKDIFSLFAENNKDDYMNIRLLDNPERSQAAGWNKAISAALGDCVIRLDAHGEIPADFLEKNIECIKSGEFVCGGARPNIAESSEPWQEMLLSAESSMFGSSFAGYRRKTESKKKYVSSVFHGCYRREVFEKVGGFNESLGRTEDNELHWRICQNGYKICQSREIVSYQLIRASLGGILKQKYGNGKWIGLTLGVCPKCISVFHFVPFCFVLAIVIGTALAVIGGLYNVNWLILPIILLAVLYIFADILMTLSAVAGKKKNICQFLLPIVFFMLHISYGFGTTIGLLKLSFWKKSLDNDKINKRIEEVGKSVKENSGKKLKEGI